VFSSALTAGTAGSTENACIPAFSFMLISSEFFPGSGRGTLVYVRRTRTFPLPPGMRDASFADGRLRTSGFRNRCLRVRGRRSSINGFCQNRPTRRASSSDLKPNATVTNRKPGQGIAARSDLLMAMSSESRNTHFRTLGVDTALFSRKAAALPVLPLRSHELELFGVVAFVPDAVRPGSEVVRHHVYGLVSICP
jgi:hypothetical protein